MTLSGTVSMKWQRIIVVIFAIKKNKYQFLLYRISVNL